MLLEIILAIIPIAWLIISMAGLKMAGYKSCGIGLVIAIVEGVAVYHMTVPEADHRYFRRCCFSGMADLCYYRWCHVPV